MATEAQLRQRIISRIKARATAMKMPLSHVPDRAGVSRSHFWEVLGGRKSPTIRWLCRVAEALEIDAGDLVTKGVQAYKR